MNRENRTENAKRQYERLVQGMRLVPEQRKTATDENVKWFLRKGAIDNRFDPNVDDAIFYAKQIIQ